MKNWKPNTKLIEFDLVNPLLSTIDKPVPALKDLPDWYKDMSPYMFGGDEFILQNKQTNLTVKKCVPFLDALGAGYFIPTPADVLVKQMPDGPKITWLAEFDIVSEHAADQIKGIDIPEGYSKQPFKWNNPWVIKTPKGYSCLFVHPMNRYDLPFYSFAGIVDTDKFPLTINFPFLMSNNFNGVIESGTPMIQVIPFKRDNWNSKFESQPDVTEYSKNLFDFTSKVKHYYRNKFWVRKNYK